MKDNIGRKGLVLGIILLFVGAGVIPSTVSVIENKTSFAGTISPGYIQDLIDNASPGDTIYIPSGTYYENIIINKSINLVGENKHTTVIDGSGSGDVVYVSADWVNISGFTIQNSGNIIYPIYDAGIDIRSNNNTITGNTISNNNEGIHLGNSNYNNITSNTISNNGNNGIYFFQADSNSIIYNTISNNDDGIYQFNSWHNNITSNIISNNNDGIYLSVSYMSTIIGNFFFNNGIWTSSSYHNTVENNMVNGKPLVYLEDESDKIITDAGQVILVNCYNIIVENLDISSVRFGIGLWETEYSKIRNNDCSNIRFGIYLRDSNNNTISSNTISSNDWDGIFLGSSSSNNINGNTIISNNEDGIYLSYSSSNTITGNTISTNNNEGIHLRKSHRNTIMGNTLSDNENGIILTGSDFNTVSGNTIISNNLSGIIVWAAREFTQNNSITGNTIILNSFGIFLYLSSNNTILKNNFLNNKIQAIFINCSNTWKKNYWNRPRILPKIILGFNMLTENFVIPSSFQMDWRPAIRPYDIGV